jgi:hypothetical protein
MWYFKQAKRRKRQNWKNTPGSPPMRGTEIEFKTPRPLQPSLEPSFSFESGSHFLPHSLFALILLVYFFVDSMSFFA